MPLSCLGEGALAVGWPPKMCLGCHCEFRTGASNNDSGGVSAHAGPSQSHCPSSPNITQSSSSSQQRCGLLRRQALERKGIVCSRGKSNMYRRVPYRDGDLPGKTDEMTRFLRPGRSDELTFPTRRDYLSRGSRVWSGRLAIGWPAGMYL